MTNKPILGVWLAGILALSLAAAGDVRAQASGAAKPMIVLVHGAFADASGWGKVIQILDNAGYPVIAVQNPLESLSGDIATTKRVVDAQNGPVVLVGHSYGGAVITGAAAGSPNVKALVYLAAFAPDAGEPLGSLGSKYPATPLSSALKPDSAGFLYIDRAQFHEAFCADLPLEEAKVMAATQKPLHNSVFTASVDQATWKTIPSWYVVSQEDKAINPDLERFYAKRAGAKTTEVKASHVAFMTHPDEIARVIEEAANEPAGANAPSRSGVSGSPRQ